MLARVLLVSNTVDLRLQDVVHHPLHYSITIYSSSDPFEAETQVHRVGCAFHRPSGTPPPVIRSQLLNEKLPDGVLANPCPCCVEATLLRPCRFRSLQRVAGKNDVVHECAQP